VLNQSSLIDYTFDKNAEGFTRAGVYMRDMLKITNDYHNKTK